MKEHDGCFKCIYEKLEAEKEPCCNCKHGATPSKGVYKTAPDLWTDGEDDNVNHPNHYCQEGSMECIDEMVEVFGREATMNFCLLNVWKYRKRALFKNKEEDLKKSDWYMNKYVELKNRLVINQ